MSSSFIIGAVYYATVQVTLLLAAFVDEIMKSTHMKAACTKLHFHVVSCLYAV